MTRAPWKMQRAGLTLIELLAAVVILSAVAAAFASMTQDASRTLREAHTDSDSRAGHQDARLALALWELSQPNLATDLASLARDADEREALAERTWEFLDYDGARWLIHASAPPEGPPAPPRAQPAAHEDHETWTQRVALVSLSITDRDGRGMTLTTRRLAPLPARVPPGNNP